MLKRLLLSCTALIIFGLAFSLSSTLSHAQNPNPADTAGSNASSPACPQVAWSCAEVTDLDEGDPGKPHRQRLQQSGLPPTDSNGNPNQFYIACGINTDEGFLLTTGNSSHDDKLCLGEDTYQKLQDNYSYVFDTLDTPNPLTSSDGSIDVTVKPYNYGAPKHHMCMIGWVLDVTTTGSEGTSTNPATSETSGLEYTTFTFPTGQASCTTVYADPYGRTYNEDLKPVPGAQVSIYDFDSKELMNLPGLPNPVTTKEDGIFNFNVPPGRSFLRSPLTNLLEVHPNYSLAYTEPYQYGDVIVERLGKAEQRDIAVQGGNNPVLKLMGYSHVKTGDHILIQGSASWPLTIVDIMQGTTSIAQQQSDKFGTFEFRLDPGKIDPTQEVRVKLTEVDLTADPNSTASNPATDDVVFDPIPSYLEGYAYNSDGELVPFATVRVRLEVSDGIYHETKADGDAFYSVSPRNLPILPYYIEVIPPNALPTDPIVDNDTDTTVTPTAGATATPGAGEDPFVTTPPSTGGIDVAGASRISIPEYARQNKEYHDVEVIDIMTGTKNGTKVDPIAVADTGSAVYGGSETNVQDQDSVPDTAEDESSDDSEQNLIGFTLLVVALIFIVTAAVVLVRKKGRDDVLGDKEVYKRDDSSSSDSTSDVSNPSEE